MIYDDQKTSPPPLAQEILESLRALTGQPSAEQSENDRNDR